MSIILARNYVLVKSVTTRTILAATLTTSETISVAAIPHIPRLIAFGTVNPRWIAMSTLAQFPSVPWSEDTVDGSQCEQDTNDEP